MPLMLIKLSVLGGFSIKVCISLYSNKFNQFIASTSDPIHDQDFADGIVYHGLDKCESRWTNTGTIKSMKHSFIDSFQILILITSTFSLVNSVWKWRIPVQLTKLQQKTEKLWYVSHFNFLFIVFFAVYQRFVWSLCWKMVEVQKQQMVLQTNWKSMWFQMQN